VCDDTLVLRKAGRGKDIVFEGIMNETYFKVRDLVYSQFQFV